MVPPEQSADLRDYFNKHTKTDKLDSKMLARMPMLHPEGLREMDSLGPGESLKRAVRHRSSLQKRRLAAEGRLDTLLELLGPGWLDSFSTAARPRPLWWCWSAMRIPMRCAAWDGHGCRRC